MSLLKLGYKKMVVFILGVLSLSICITCPEGSQLLCCEAAAWRGAQE